MNRRDLLATGAAAAVAAVVPIPAPEVAVTLYAREVDFTPMTYLTDKRTREFFATGAAAIAATALPVPDANALTEQSLIEAIAEVDAPIFISARYVTGGELVYGAGSEVAALVQPDGRAVRAGDLVAGGAYGVKWDGNNWVLCEA